MAPGFSHASTFGTDRREAEVRYARLLKLYDDDCKAHAQQEWTSRGLEYARRMAAGATAVEYGLNRGDDDYDATVVLPEYAAKVEIDRQRFPSLTIVPSNPERYAESARRSDAHVVARLAKLESKLRSLGALRSGGSVPDRLIAGSSTRRWRRMPTTCGGTARSLLPGLL